MRDWRKQRGRLREEEKYYCPSSTPSNSLSKLLPFPELTDREYIVKGRREIQKRDAEDIVRTEEDRGRR